MKQLSHTDRQGKAKMVDISNKTDMFRIATATGHIKLEKDTINLIKNNTLAKGDVLSISEIAGILAGKKTAELIPLCHPLNITNISVKAKLDKSGVCITATASCTGKTGIEMEVLTATSVALLTIYDMCKAVDKNMLIDQIKLISKEKKEL